MRFNDHSKLIGEHAFLSASNNSWVNYNEEKLIDRYQAVQATVMGTRLHNLAAEHIRLGIKMPRTNATFNAYVNDAIGYRLKPEQVLYYSPNCFGTADAIGFDEKKRLLRIHDLKTGVTRVTMTQLEVYSSLFCLEYKHKPFDINFELRIYQNDEIYVHTPEATRIVELMDRIRHFDSIINQIKEEY